MKRYILLNFKIVIFPNWKIILPDFYIMLQNLSLSTDFPLNINPTVLFIN